MGAESTKTPTEDKNIVTDTFKKEKFKIGKWLKTRSGRNSAGTSGSVIVSTLPASRRQFSKRQKISFSLGIVVVLALAIAGGVLVWHNQSYVLKVSGNGKTFKLTQKEYVSLIDQAKQQGVPEDRAKETIIKAYQYKIVAPRLNLAPSEDEIVRAAQAGTDYAGEGQLNDWEQLYGYISGVEGNVKMAQVGGYVAASLIYPFDKVYYNENQSAYDSTPDKVAILSAKQAATAQATGDRQQLVSNGTTAAALISKLQNDPQRTWAGGSNSSKLLRITENGITYADNEALTYTEPGYIMSAISSLNKKPGVSDVREIRATVYGAPGPDVIGYFFVSVSSVVAANQNITSDLTQMLKTVKVVNNAP